MTPKTMVLLLFAGLAPGWMPATSAHANESPLPDSVYPPHTRISYYPDWSNQQFDCNFGWFCGGEAPQPYVHMMTEDQLHRTAGWATWGEWRHDTMGFELYSSVYDTSTPHDGATWNQLAATDEQLMLGRVQLARAATTIPRVFRDGMTGGTFAYYLDRPHWHVFFLTAWWGSSHEIEAAVVYPKKQKWKARRYLVEQVRAAVDVAGEDMR